MYLFGCSDMQWLFGKIFLKIFLAEPLDFQTCELSGISLTKSPCDYFILIGLTEKTATASFRFMLRA